MKDLRSAILLFILFTIICGGIYPAVVTGLASALFPKQAGGSLITDTNNRVLGSSLIGQPFSESKYFWPRPSATSGFGYNPLASGGSNASPASPDFIKAVADRVLALQDSGVTGSLPADLVEASASGLDPHVSPKAVQVQIARVAKARGMTEEDLAKVVSTRTLDRQWGIFGQPRVNVLQLNLALDGMRR